MGGEAYQRTDVCGYAKVLIFLQITTVSHYKSLGAVMYADTQRY